MESKREIINCKYKSGQLSILASKTASFSGKPKKSAAEHREIMKAIDQKKLELAKRIIQDHIKSTKIDSLTEVQNILEKKEINLDIKINEIILSLIS